MLDPGSIQPNPFQPRRHFDADALEELANSLRAHGVLQPIVVRQVESGYELVAGERRLRAAVKVGLARVPAIVRRDMTDDRMLELALVENVQRRDLDPIERALGYRQLLERLALTQEEVARRVGLNRATVTNHLRLLDLPAMVQEAIGRGQIQMGHARALLGLPHAHERVELANRIMGEGLSVREVERIVREREEDRRDRARSGSASGANPGANSDANPDAAGSDASTRLDGSESWVHAVQERLQEALGTKVELRTRPGYTGQIVVHYFDRDDLQRLLDRLAPPRTI